VFADHLRYSFLPLESSQFSELNSASRGNGGSTAVTRALPLEVWEYSNLFLSALSLLKAKRLDFE
jgi:hypothetical protein